MTNCAPLRAGTPKLSAAGPDRNVTMPSLKLSCADAAAAKASDIAAADASMAARLIPEKRILISSPSFFRRCSRLCPVPTSLASAVEGSLGGLFSCVYGGLERLDFGLCHLAVENGDRPGPAGRGPLDLDRKARDGEAGRGQQFEVVQLFDVAIADVAAGLVAFPDQAGVLGLSVLLRGIDERRIPAPAVDPRQPHATLQQIHRRLIPHAAAGSDVVLPAILGAGAGVDDDDLERRQRVADALEFGFDIFGGRDIAIRQMTEIKLHAGLQAPFQRHFVDGP